MIVYYLSSHGFGHAVRACEVIRRLPLEIPLMLRTALPEWFLRRELAGRPFKLSSAQFDCGVLGPDSMAVDLRRTLDQIESLLDRNWDRLQEEVAWLGRIGARLVVADVPPFALRVARLAGLPSILIANFTWSAIYQHLLDHTCDDNALADRTRRVIDRLQVDYDEGDLLLATEFSVPMTACRQRREVGLVTRRGIDRRHLLIEGLGLDPGRPIYLLYLGREGLRGMSWDRLGELEGIQLISYVAPAGAEAMVTVLPEDLIEHGDVAASVDGVIAKAGYGICGECIAASTGLLYPPRPHFSEQLAIDRVMDRWGGAVRIGEEDFKALNWRPSLDRLRNVDPRKGCVDLTGGKTCTSWLERVWREGRVPPAIDL